VFPEGAFDRQRLDRVILNGARAVGADVVDLVRSQPRIPQRPLDGLDGALARRLNQTSRAGAFLDSNFDRLSEIAVYLGLVWHYQAEGFPAGVILTYLTITGSLMVSYTRARAEALGAECQVGIMTRMERFVVLLIGLFSGYMTAALAALAAFTYVTVLQRIWHTRKELK